MAEVLKKFGRYFLLDQIAQGGMAEIYRARLATLEAAGRILVIKRIQASFGSNSEFQQMFKSEIKVTMGFNHPNIAQVYDFGEEDQQPYIAMEWIDGKNIRQFLNRFNELGQGFPIDLAAYVIEQAAGGMHYAHSYKDKITGEHLLIVHRDISPQNILIAFEGTIKVIDFGIAKASTNSEATRAGVIKGKPSYLSPEQIAGDVLDGRSDIFALGAVLWELLTGRKLFTGENDLAVLKQIENAANVVKPPSTHNSMVPKELDTIVLRALTKDRTKRYQTAEEFQRALHKFLYAFNPDFNPSDLSYYAKDLFKNEIVEDRKLIQRLNEKVEQLLNDGAPDVAGAPGVEQTDTVTERDPETTSIAGISRASSRRVGIREILDPPEAEIGAVGRGGLGAVELDPLRVARRGGGPIQMERRQARMPRPQGVSPERSALGWKTWLGALALLPAAVWFAGELGVPLPNVTQWLGGESGSVQDSRIVLRGKMSNVTVAVNGQTVSRSLPATLKGVPVGIPVVIAVSGSEGQFEETLVLKAGESREIPVVLSRRDLATAPVPSAGSDRRAKEESSSVSAPSAPIASTSAESVANRPSPSNGPSNGPSSGPSGSPSATTVPGAPSGSPASAPPAAGMIALRLNLFPKGAGTRVRINGRELSSDRAAVSIRPDVPVVVEVSRPGYFSYRREFVVRADEAPASREWPMDITLEPQRFGFLTIRTTPSADAIFAIEGMRVKERTPLEKRKIPVGTYHIRLVNDVLGMEKVVTVQVQDGRAVTLEERLQIREDRAPSSE